MNAGTQNEPQLFINDLEQDARQNIIKLDQKLRGLRAEVEAKLHALTLNKEESTEENSQGLTALLAEIDKAIQAMDTLVNLIVTEDQELKNNYFQSDEMRQFNKMVSDNLERIIEIKNEF